MSVNISLAKSCKSGKYIHIDDVNKELDNDFICNCSSKLIAVKTEARKKDWHFRHPPNSKITTCRSSALHNYAVQIINENTEITITEKLKLQYSIVGKEVWVNDLYRSDITVKYQNEDVNFEVFVTHDLIGAKTRFYQDSKIKCVKIDLSNPELLSAAPEIIKDNVLNQYLNKKLIYWENNIVPNSSVPKNGISNNWIWAVIAAIILFLGFKWLSKRK